MLTNFFTQPSAYGVHPDVPRNILARVIPENVVEESRLPQAQRASIESRAVLERCNELEQVATVIRSLCQEVSVVRHHAVGMDRE